MARPRKTRTSTTSTTSSIPLKHPDRSGPLPSQQTLLDLAASRGLLNEPSTTTTTTTNEPLIGRLAEAVFGSTSLTMLHFTLDVLVAHQYAAEVVWSDLVRRQIQAFPVILLLFYTLHPHPTPSIFLPSLSPRIHQPLFAASATAAGCYLIHITNTYSYYAVMKQSPPVGCLWIWSVIELSLGWAAASLLACIGFVWVGGYNYL